MVFTVYNVFRLVYTKTWGKTISVFGKTMKNHSKNQFGCSKTSNFWKLNILKNSIFWSFESQTSHKPKCGLKCFFGGLTKFFKNFRKFWTFLQLTFFLYDVYLLIFRTISHFKLSQYENLAPTVMFQSFLLFLSFFEWFNGKNRWFNAHRCFLRP